jgi:hypothetical protein
MWMRRVPTLMKNSTKNPTIPRSDHTFAEKKLWATCRSSGPTEVGEISRACDREFA